MAPAYRRILRNPAALVATALCMLALDAWCAAHEITHWMNGIIMLVLT